MWARRRYQPAPPAIRAAVKVGWRMKEVSERHGLAPSAVLFTCLFAAQAALLVLSPILPQVAADFDVSTSTAAQLRSVSGITAGLFALVIAAKGKQVALSRLLKIGLFLLAGGALASAVSPTFLLLLASQVPLGLGLALVLSGALAASDVWAQGEEGAKLLSWALIGQPVAWIVGQPVVGAVAGVDWRWAWIAVPLGSSLAALVAMAARRPTPDGPLECDPKGLWRQPHIKSWAWGELAAFSAWAGTLVFAGAFFIESYGASVGETGLILGLVAAAYLPGNYLGRRLLRSVKAPTLLLAFAIAASVGVAIFGGLQPGVVFSLVALSILAFFAGGRTISGAALGLRLADGRRLAAMSVRTAMLQFGYLFGSAIGGVMLPVWGFAGVGWTFAGLFAVAGAVHLQKATGAPGLAYENAGRYLRRGRLRV